MWPFMLMWFVVVLGTALILAYQYFFEARDTDSVSDIAREIDIIEEFR